MRDDPAALLASFALFDGLDAGTLASIAAELEWVSIPGGETLFEAGQALDAMFIVTAGCLGAYGGADGRRFPSRMAAGELVGEMGVVSGRPRSATVRALRDSELARLPREAFERLVVQHAGLMRRVAELLVERLETVERRAAAVGTRTYAVVPLDPGVDAADFGTRLTAALARLGRAEVMLRRDGVDGETASFARIEHANDFVVYVADSDASPWTKQCLRQADAVLFVVRADAPDSRPPSDLVDMIPGLVSRAELVLLDGESIPVGAAARWLATIPVSTHHHVRGEADLRRVARLVTGRGIGLVLSGGGARGFAHIGIFRALEEAGVSIDLVGGTSVGAVMGAGVAAGWSAAEARARFSEAFAGDNTLNDYTLPLVSLVSGRKFSRRLRALFGEVAIEDLPLAFFCVTSNLTTGASSVHRRGDLRRWLLASTAIPGVLPPVCYDGEVHVDGAAVDNLPVNVMRAPNCGVVIGVDVGVQTALRSNLQESEPPPVWKLLRRSRDRPGIVQVLLRAGMVSSQRASAAARALADVLLQPPVNGVDLLDWRAFDAAVQSGYQHTRERLANLSPDLRARLMP